MQTDNHSFTKNFATNKKYILRKMGLKIQNPKFSFSCKIAFMFFVMKFKAFGVKRSVRPFWSKQMWLYKIVCFNFLRNYNYTQNWFPIQCIEYSYQNFLPLFVYHHHLYTCFYNWNIILNYWFICKIDIFI